MLKGKLEVGKLGQQVFGKAIAVVRRLAETVGIVSLKHMFCLQCQGVDCYKTLALIACLQSRHCNSSHLCLFDCLVDTSMSL